MKKLVLILALILMVGIVGGVIFLASWNLPITAAKVEKPLPDDRMAR